MAATLITAVLYSKILAALFSMLGVHDGDLLGRGYSDFTHSTALALLLTVASLYYALKSTVTYHFVREVSLELVKVTWPSFDESKLQTRNTIIVTLIICVILLVFDKVFGFLTNILLGI
jgi:preprotein translocase SecE subunit